MGDFQVEKEQISVFLTKFRLNAWMRITPSCQGHPENTGAQKIQKEENPMRNLKRALSLAVASVMMIGMMVVGTGAVSYADVTSEDNQEAIEVLQTVGIMVGDTDGNFNPDANVTRNEMAVIMSNLMDYNVTAYAGTTPFTDVPDWAEPYVAACYLNGITGGTSETT